MLKILQKYKIIYELSIFIIIIQELIIIDIFAKANLS